MKKQITFLIICFLGQLAFAQPGTIDHTFNSGDIGFGHGDGPDSYVVTMANQSDGKFLIGGEFRTYNGISHGKIARLNPDGTLDLTFEPGTGFLPPWLSQIHTIEVLTNGKILVGGNFSIYNGEAVNNLVQLNPDGSLDQTFDPGTGPNHTVSVIREQPDGRILIGGRFTSYNDVNTSYLARLNPGGSIDTNFMGPELKSESTVSEILILPDNRVMIGGKLLFDGDTSEHVVRLLENGSLDSTFNSDIIPVFSPWFGWGTYLAGIHSVENNKYILIGRFRAFGMDSFECIVQLNENGGLDGEFQIPNIAGPEPGVNPGVRNMFENDDGKLLIFGQFGSVNGVPNRNAAMLYSDGTLVTSLPPADVAEVGWAIIQENGRVVVASWDYDVGLSNDFLARLNDDLSYDGSFNANTGANAKVKNIHVLSNQKILMIGNFRFYNGTPSNGIIRIMPDGSPDASFNPVVEAYTGGKTYAIAEQDNGKVVAGGVFLDHVNLATRNIVRFNSNGSLDPSFYTAPGANRAIIDIKIQSDEKIVVAGDFTLFNDTTANRIVRLNKDGNIDEAFNTVHGADKPISCIIIQPDDKILIGGAFTMFDSIPRSRIAMLNTDGSLDMDFDPGNGFQSYGGINNPVVNEIGLQQDGKIIATGDFMMYNNVPVNRVVRLNQDGSLDTTFNPGYGANDEVESMTIQPDDKIILAGSFTMFDSIPANRIVRLNENGSVDTTFIIGTGANGRIREVAIHEHERIIIAGDFTAYDGTGRNRIARIMGDEPDGVRNDFRLAALKVYPNPAQDFIYIEADRYLQGASIRLYDLQGRVVAENLDSNGQTFRFDIAQHEPGVYIIEVRTSEFIGRQKVIRY